MVILDNTIVNAGTVKCVTNIFQFTMVKFTLVNFHGYGGKNKDDPSPITNAFTRKIGGYISSLSKLCLFCCPAQKKTHGKFQIRFQEDLSGLLR